jgi:hypothetical protein
VVVEGAEPLVGHHLDHRAPAPREAPLDEGREDGLEGLALQVVEEDLRHRAADPQLS